MANRVMTAPLAIIKVGGVAVGKMKNIRCTETIRRTEVVGLGTIFASEFAVTKWNGTLNCSFFMVDLSVQAIPNALLRNVQTAEEFENTLLLNNEGVQIDILRKVEGAKVNNIIVPRYEVVATIMGAFAERESWDITENQISGRDMDFVYGTPFLFPQ